MADDASDSDSDFMGGLSPSDFEGVEEGTDDSEDEVVPPNAMVHLPSPRAQLPPPQNSAPAAPAAPAQPSTTAATEKLTKPVPRVETAAQEASASSAAADGEHLAAAEVPP